MKDYVNQPMITYLGNKRKLVDNIESVVKKLNPNICVRCIFGFRGCSENVTDT